MHSLVAIQSKQITCVPLGAIRDHNGSIFPYLYEHRLLGFMYLITNDIFSRFPETVAIPKLETGIMISTLMER